GPALMQIASLYVGADEQGQLQGAFSAIRAVTGMLGPIVFTQVLALAIGDDVVIPWAGVAFGLSAALLFASMIAAAFATRPSLLAAPLPSPAPPTPPPAPANVGAPSGEPAAAASSTDSTDGSRS